MNERIHLIERDHLRDDEILFGHHNATVQIYRSSDKAAYGLVLGGLGDFDPTADNPLFRKMLRTCGDNTEGQVMAATVYDTPLLKHDEFHAWGDPTDVLNVPMVKDFMESFIQFAKENGDQFRVTANSLGGALFMTSYLASIKVLTNHKDYSDQRVQIAQEFLKTLNQNVTDAVIYSPSVGFQDYPNFQSQVIRAAGTHTLYYTPLKPLIRGIASRFGTNKMKSGRLLELSDKEKLAHAEEKSESMVLMGKALKKMYRSLPEYNQIMAELRNHDIDKLPTILTVTSIFDHQLNHKVLNPYLEPLGMKKLIKILRLDDSIWHTKIRNERGEFVYPDMHSPFMNDELWETLLTAIESALKANE